MNTYSTEVAQVESAPVRSRQHIWTKTERRQYDSMHHNGRRLYDNLRTQLDYSHDLAFSISLLKYGRKGGY